MRKHIFRHLLFILLAIVALWQPAGAVNEIGAMLSNFDRNASVENANRLLEQYAKAEITEGPIVFKQGTPADTLRQQVWYWTAEYYYAAQEYERAISYGLKALPLCKVGNNRVVEGDCLNLLAVIYIRLSDYENAAKYAKQCYELDRKSGDPDVMSSSLNTLAAIYMGARQPREAERYVLQGIALAQKANNPPRLAVLYGMASEVYHTLGGDANEKKSLDYARKAYDLEVKLGRKDKAAMRQTQMAAALLWLKRTDEAKAELEKAMPQLRANGNVQSLGIACNQMGGVLLAEKDYIGAEKYYREAAAIFVQLKDYYNESHSRLGLYNALKERDAKAALHEMEKYKSLKDSIYDHATAESLGRYGAELGNQQLKDENEAVRTSRNHAVVLGVVIALLLALLSAVVWWVMRRRNRRQVKLNDRLRAVLERVREENGQLQQQYADLAAQIKRGESETGEDAQGGSRFIDEVLGHIDSLIDEGQADVQHLAERMHMSAFQLRQRLSEFTDEKPQALIQGVRMKRACYLLEHHRELNVTEVAALCGYGDAPNFTRAFKRATGQTPTQYAGRE